MQVYKKTDNAAIDTQLIIIMIGHFLIDPEKCETYG